MLQRYKKNRTLASFYSLNMRLFLLNSTTGLFQCPRSALRIVFLFIELKINYLLRYSCIDLAALRPSDIAKITVAPPRTISPPANNIGIDDCI